MKKWSFIALVTLLAVGLYNCSNEFELTEKWEDITIVNGLLDASDTVQYIRVEKAFLDEETSALVLAQEADSLFYDNITVQLQELPNGGGVGQFYILDRVDANLEGFQKDEGIFANSPNYLYKLDRNLVPSSAYRLIISSDDKDDVTAETDVIDGFSILNPNAQVKFRLRSESAQNFTWIGDDDAKFYDLILRIHYTEAPLSDPTDITSKVLDWVLAEGIRPETGSSVITYELSDGADFYKFLQQELTPTTDLERTIAQFDVLIYAGGEELLNYVDAGRATSGITSAETLPAYSNVSNGLGLFSTRYKEEMNGIGLTGSMRDTLKFGPYTSDLGFKGQ